VQYISLRGCLRRLRGRRSKLTVEGKAKTVTNTVGTYSFPYRDGIASTGCDDGSTALLSPTLPRVYQIAQKVNYNHLNLAPRSGRPQVNQPPSLRSRAWPMLRGAMTVKNPVVVYRAHKTA